jgi:hypothetical protein
MAEGLDYMKQQELRRKAKEMLKGLVSAPLYAPITVPDEDMPELVQFLRTFPDTIDNFCPQCGSESLWALDISSRIVLSRKVSDGVKIDWYENFSINLQCVRQKEHTAAYHFDVQMDCIKDFEFLTVITKVGQYPSLRDFAAGDIKKFASISHSLRREFVQAINTGAHGFNVAACVHYRRVFEGLLNEVRDEHLEESGQLSWPEFDDGNTSDKIRLLGHRLPEFLREHPHLYRLLSVGVHQLSEDECAEELPVVRQAIELVLEDRVAQIEQRRRRTETQKLLADSLSRLSKRDAGKTQD